VQRGAHTVRITQITGDRVGDAGTRELLGLGRVVDQGTNLEARMDQGRYHEAGELAGRAYRQHPHWAAPVA
jgi:hypothetical protein